MTQIPKPTAKALRIGYFALLCCVAFGACSTEELDKADACEDIAESIAARVLVCTGDDDLATASREEFEKRLNCAPTVDTSFAFECARAVGRTPCAQVKLGLEPWLFAVTECAGVYAGVDAGLDGGDGSADAFSDAADSGPDSAQDATVDAQPDAPHEAGSDAQSDSGSDAPSDAPPDVDASDASPDTGADATADAGGAG
ncbi:MAG TPA: hypothetical protein PKA88_06065 [Polyangiaceae bacterium]|nr:hypothetical protein [Polyangiaceae bacterium]HMR78847.1 hypothetical protein [Polyangiaceae bacterium]